MVSGILFLHLIICYILIYICISWCVYPSFYFYDITLCRPHINQFTKSAWILENNNDNKIRRRPDLDYSLDSRWISVNLINIHMCVITQSVYPEKIFRIKRYTFYKSRTRELIRKKKLCLNIDSIFRCLLVTTITLELISCHGYDRLTSTPWLT